MAGERPYGHARSRSRRCQGDQRGHAQRRTAINATYTAKYDGSSSEVTGEGSPYDSISVKQGDANTFTYEAKNSKTKYRVSGRVVISGDGKTMTTTASGVAADGKPMTMKLVYDKQ